MQPSDPNTASLKRAKNPNFLLIVILSAVALIGLFIVAYLVVGDKGKRMLPGLHRDPQPTSYALPSTDRKYFQSLEPCLG